MAWFCSMEIGGAMVVGLVWVFCMVGLWWSMVVLVYWVYDFFLAMGLLVVVVCSAAVVVCSAGVSFFALIFCCGYCG